MPRINYSCPQKLDKLKTERGGGRLQLQDKPATPTTLTTPSVDSSVCQTHLVVILNSCNMIDPSL